MIMKMVKVYLDLYGFNNGDYGLKRLLLNSIMKKYLKVINVYILCDDCYYI